MRRKYLPQPFPWIFEEDEYKVKGAETKEKAMKLIEAGFEYVTQIDGARLFRKRK